MKINGSDFKGQVNLLDVSHNNAHIMQHHVDTREDDCLFTGLTSARLYCVDYEGLEDCTVVISGDKWFSSAASSRELRFSFGVFIFFRYNGKKVVRLEHHFLSYRVKGPLEQ